MAELKTRVNNDSVEKFISEVEDEQKRNDCYAILKLMKHITKEEPKMWGSNIIGFGSYHYIYASGQEGDWPLTGFSPRKQNLTLYIMSVFDRYNELMAKLGKYKTGKSCLYIKKLKDIDLDILKELINESVICMKKKYPGL
jgi:hypothetical protein